MAAKLRIFEAHAEVLQGEEWDEKRRDAAERFYLEREKLFREIWGLGLVRHVLNLRYHPPSWYRDWANRPPSDELGEDDER